MKDNGDKLIGRLEIACQRMNKSLESQKIAPSNEVKKLSNELRTARQKISSLELTLVECKAKAKALEKTSHELAELRAARSRDLEEVAAIMAELQQLKGG